MSELHEAAFSGNVVALEGGLQKGLSPNEPDLEWGNRTPLHIASAQGHRRCVFYLLAAGANVNVVSNTGWTAGHYACETGQVTKILIVDLPLS